MPLACLSSWLGSGDLAGDCQADQSVITAPVEAHGAANIEAFHSFLGARPARTSFKFVKIKFNPKVPESDFDPITMPCESDREVCEEQCKLMFGARPEYLQKPCMDAVAAQFGGPACFPGIATVQERRRGTIRVGDVEVGDELAVSGGSFSRVAAMLHDNANVTEVYLRVQYDGGSLLISPQHLVRARLHGQCEEDPVDDWSWTAAEDIRPQDELSGESGVPVIVQSIARICLVGAFAPLTGKGELLVDGVLCSSYAPPSAWRVPHSACHAVMLPVRLLDNARQAVENLTSSKDGKGPLFSVDAVWLLPKLSDESLHPWASGLLRAAMATQVSVAHCKAALLPSAPRVAAVQAAQ